MDSDKSLRNLFAKGGKNPRFGRVLTEEDILHYRGIVVALTKTHRPMAEIDKTIDEHGGGLSAFLTAPEGTGEIEH
jgi:hypothetical protein